MAVVAPPSPREAMVRFAELTGVAAARAVAYVQVADGHNVPLDKAIASFLETGQPVDAARLAAARLAIGDPLPPKRPRLAGADDKVPSAAAAIAARTGPAASATASAGVIAVTAAVAEAPLVGRVIPEAEALAARGIPDGCETQLSGGSGPYRITRRGDVYTCTCPAWRNQKLGPYRTCKHVRELRGDEAERLRLVDAGHVPHLEVLRAGLAGGAASSGGGSGGAAAAKAAACVGGKNPHIEKGVMLAHNWDEGKVNPKGYLMSEKLDGMRAIWDAGGLWSRAGNSIAAPAYFLAALPKGVKLDGELFLGRGRFQDVMSVCRSGVPNETAWRRVRYVVFDAPSTAGGLAERLAAARAAIPESAAEVVRVHPQVVCEGVDHVYKELDRILALVPPAEGLMLAVPNKPHRGGRCNDILKVKKFHTDDAKVVGHKLGKGRLVGRLGALECRLRSGHRFDVGSGFSDADRDAYLMRYPVGTIVEFRYFEITDGGVPRFPTFLRVRPDLTAAEFPA